MTPIKFDWMQRFRVKLRAKRTQNDLICKIVVTYGNTISSKAEFEQNYGAPAIIAVFVDFYLFVH